MASACSPAGVNAVPSEWVVEWRSRPASSPLPRHAGPHRGRDRSEDGECPQVDAKLLTAGRVLDLDMMCPDISDNAAGGGIREYAMSVTPESDSRRPNGAGAGDAIH